MPLSSKVSRIAAIRKLRGAGIEPLAAGVKRRVGDDLLIALVDAAAGKHQRARVKVDLIMAHHHEDFDFARCDAVAQQQDGGGGRGATASRT